MPTTDPIPSVDLSSSDSAQSSVVDTALRDDARVQMECACVDLISQFESMLTRSDKERLDGYSVDIVPIVNTSLQIASEFGESHLIGEVLDLLNMQIDEAHECLQSLRAAISSVEWKTFRRMIGRKSASELDVLRIHSELGDAIAKVIVAALGPAIELLGTESKSGDEMLGIVRLFIAELQERW